jgi:anti-sigma factor RsiW
MSDCQNVEVRDLLPELLHEALPAGRRALVEAHVADCADCAAELDVLRLVRATTSALVTARLDVPGIVAALPRPAVARRRPAPSRTLWRIAAAVTFVALGGISLAVVRQYFGGVPVIDSTGVSTSVAGVTATPGPAVPPDSPRTAATTPVALTAGGGVGDLADEDLEALIGALDRMEAAPHAEPDAGGFARIVSGATGGS